MNKILVYISLASFVGLGVFAEGTGAGDIPTLIEFQSLDSVERFHRLKVIAVSAPEHLGDQALPLLNLALSDSDVDVRRMAIFVLVRIATWNLHAERIEKPIETNIATYQPIHETLWNAMSDPDEDVRENALITVWHSYTNNTKYFEFLISRFWKEPSGQIRALIIGVLTEEEYHTSEVDRTIISALQDSNTELQGMGAKAAARFTPPAALPLLGAGLESTEKFVKFNCVDAVGAYGESASAYIPTLEEMYKGVTNKYDRAKIKSAINQLHGTAVEK